jgi:Xaa-Pro aminopeptidase
MKAASPETLRARLQWVRQRMHGLGIDALLLSLGADLPWLCGYEAMPLERLTMLVVPTDEEPTLVVPHLEAPRVDQRGGVFVMRPWSENEDPVQIVARLVGRRTALAVSDRTWARFLVALQEALPDAAWSLSSEVIGPLRAVKDAEEIEALAAASAAADRVAAQLLSGRVPLVGRSELEVSADLGRRLLEEGHQRVNFAIVASGPNSASPHHSPGERVIAAEEPVVCDFGGTMDGYCSDITRTVWTAGSGGVSAPAEFLDLYELLRQAQAKAVASAMVGTPCEDVDKVAREVITGGGFGEAFIHRTGHGIGLEEHEDPYIVEGNRVGLEMGHAFSIEPGIYIAGRFGARIEDIVVATDAGPRVLNSVSREFTVVEA